MGTSTLVLQGEFWRSDISKIHKLCFLNGLFYYLQTSLVGGVRLKRFFSAKPATAVTKTNADAVGQKVRDPPDRRTLHDEVCVGEIRLLEVL